MRKFKSAKTLGIRDDIFNALADVLQKLEAGELVHVPLDAGRYQDMAPPTITNGFNMSHWDLNQDGYPDCGTICCIGGWADRLHNVNLNNAICESEVEFSEADASRPVIPDELYNVMYPDGINFEWASIKPEQAAKALRNFLTTGKPRWVDVIGQ